MAGAGAEVRNPKATVWVCRVMGVQSLELLLLPPTVCTSRKLEPRVSNMG